MAYHKLKELIQYLEEFEAKNPEKTSNLHDFALWLNNELRNQPLSPKSRELNYHGNINKQSTNTQISILIGRMARYANNYSKKIFSNTNISSLEEFTFLSTLMFKTDLSKAELSRQNLMEITSGADIIKRLIKKKLVEIFDDTTDKRSKRVRITDFGKITMFQVFKEMETVTEIITGNLMDWEKLYLLSALKKLDNLHKKIYPEVKKQELWDIKAKYID